MSMNGFLHDTGVEGFGPKNMWPIKTRVFTWSQQSGDFKNWKVTKRLNPGDWRGCPLTPTKR